MLRIHSSSIAFYIVVSALPLAAILIFVLSALSVSLVNELEALLYNLLPREFYYGLVTVIDGIEKNRVPSFVPFSIITALWGSTKGVGGICYGIEKIFGTKERHTFILRSIKTIWRTLLFYVLIIASLVLFAIGRLIYVQDFILKLLILLRIPIFALFLSLFFALLYARLSGTKIKSQLPGGIFSSVGWMLFTYFYSIYVSHALSSANIYAEMGTLIFFVLWCYFCVNIILIGAEINKSLIP